LAILLLPTIVSAENWSSIESDTAIYGRVVKVKNTTSTDKCKKLADKYGAVAYSIDSKKGKCSVLKSVRATTDKEGFTSQRRASN